MTNSPTAPTIPAQRPQRRIFLSYGHDEFQTLAKRLKDDLVARGHEVWFDREQLKPGEDWEHCLERGLEWAAWPGENGCILLLMTPHAVRRPDGYCLNEIAGALTKNLPPIPVMVAQVEPPLSIARIQWFDMTACVPLESAGPLYGDRRDRLLDAIESGKVDYEGTQAWLLSLLRPIEFSAEKLRHLREFTGREWVLKEIQQWLADPDASRVFWLTGGPGVGKTALSVWLASRALPAIKAWHLCQHNHQVNKDPRRCVMSLAYYLAALIPAYFEKLSKRDIRIDADKDAWTLFDLLLVQPLTQLKPPEEQAVILIDALDEATQSDGTNQLAQFIGEQFNLMPDWLRLIVTARPASEVQCWLTGFDPWILNTTDPRNVGDIKLYANQRLEHHRTTGSLDAAAAAIAQRSEGVFLYAEYVCDEIIAGRIDMTRPKAFPKGLGAIYAGFFKRRFPNREEYESLFAPVFEMVAAAYEPLRINDLADHFRWEQRRERYFRDRLGALFKIEGDRIEPFHKSLMDWLTGSDSAAYYVGPDDGRKALTNWGWEAYQRDGPAEMPRYFLKHLVQHLIGANRWDELEIVLTDLRYVDARCREAQTFDLVYDYTAVLDALPELRPARERRDRLQANLNRYAHALIDYATSVDTGMSPPEPPDSRESHARMQQAESRLSAEPKPLATKSRCERIRTFATFVSNHRDALNGWPQDTVVIARNHACDGVVVAAAEPLAEALDRGWVARDPRPPVPPERPPCRHVFREFSSQSDGGDALMLRAVAVTPDGKTAVTGSDDGALGVWDTTTGRYRRTLREHTERVSAVAVTADGKTAVSGSWDGTLRVWDLPSCKCLRTLDGHTQEVNTVALTPDGSTAVSGSQDCTLRVWDLAGGESSRTLESQRGEGDEVNCVAVTADGNTAVAGSRDGALRIWDLVSECHRTLQKTDTVYNVALTPDGRTAVSGGCDRALRVWDLTTGTCQRELPVHGEDVYCVAVTPDGMTTVAAGHDAMLRVWSVETGQSLRTLDGHTRSVHGVALTPDASTAVSAGEDGTLRVWDLVRGQSTRLSQEHTGPVDAVALVPQSDKAVSGGADNTLRVWNLANGEMLFRLKGHMGSAKVMAVTPDGKTLVAGCDNGNLHAWDLTDTSHAVPRTIESAHRGGVTALVITPDGKTAISAGMRILRAWDLSAGDCRDFPCEHSRLVLGLAVTPDGRTAVSGGQDRKLCVWDLANGRCRTILDGPTDQANALSVSPDGLTLIIGSEDRTVTVWDLATNRFLRTLGGHSGPVCGVAFTPDGNHVVSGGDRTIRVWHLPSGSQVATYSAGASMRCVSSVNSDGRLVCGTDDGQVHILRLRNLPKTNYS